MASKEDIAIQLRGVLADMGLDKVPNEISMLKQSFDSLKGQYIELKHSIEYTQGRFDEVHDSLKTVSEENQNLRSRLEYAENKNGHLEKEILNMKQKLIHIEAHTMKQNLVFYNIPENPKENTRKVLIQFLKERLKIRDEYFQVQRLDGDNNSDVIWIRQCHRFGTTSPGKIRPIVAVMIEGSNLIMRQTKLLAGTKFFVTTQLPPEISENKKTVSHVFKQAKSAGKNPKYIGRGDSVLVDNVTFSVPKPPDSHVPPGDIISKVPSMHIKGSKVIEINGSRFIAHGAKITMPCDVIPTLDAIRFTHFNLATATHNMYASVTKTDKGVAEFMDDDGEYGGSRAILSAIKKANLQNVLIVVTRWYGGRNIGARRFEAISQCTEQVLKELG